MSVILWLEPVSVAVLITYAVDYNVGTIRRNIGNDRTDGGDNLPRRIWFISDGMNRKKGQEAILNLISAEIITDKSAKCGQPRIDLTNLTLPVPALKDNKHALEERLGKVSAKQFARYSNEHKVSGATVEQSLVYQLDGDRIIGVAFSQAAAK